MQKYKVYFNNKPKLIIDNIERFSKNYTFVKAAGGIVYNSDYHLLMIFRNGKWDLPKGKLDNNEDIEECAMREVEEECGVSNLIIRQFLKDTYHCYEVNGEKILKKTSWYIMETSYTKELTPQIDEGITKVEWVNKNDVHQKLKHSFASIQDLF